jgi:hypothetical protein
LLSRVRGLLVAVAGPFSPPKRRAEVNREMAGLLGGEWATAADYVGAK